MPSPEQGASTKIASKVSGQRAQSFSGAALVTTVLAQPIRSILEDRIFARAGWISLATRVPPESFLDSWVDLPPGAAQRSSTRSFGPGARTSAAAMADGS